MCTNFSRPSKEGEGPGDEASLSLVSIATLCLDFAELYVRIALNFSYVSLEILRRILSRRLSVLLLCS